MNWVQFIFSTWWLTDNCDSSYWGYNVLPPLTSKGHCGKWCWYKHAGKTLIHIIFLKNQKKQNKNNLQRCSQYPTKIDRKSLFWNVDFFLKETQNLVLTIYISISLIITMAVWWSFQAWFNVWRKLLFNEFSTSSRTY